MKKSMLELAQDGELEKIKRYLNFFGRQPEFRESIGRILDAMLVLPGEFKDPVKTATVIAGNFDFSAYFSSQNPLRAQMVWKVYSYHATPETAKVGALLAAEYLKVRLLEDLSFRQDFSILFKPESDDATLSAEAQKASVRDSVIAVQNALVDYVRGEGAAQTSRQAAGFLSMTSGMVHPGTEKLWTQKITDMPVVSQYSVTKGEVIKVSPVYAPGI